jgi:hypothetical protein
MALTALTAAGIMDVRAQMSLPTAAKPTGTDLFTQQ